MQIIVLINQKGQGKIFISLAYLHFLFLNIKKGGFNDGKR